MQINKEIDEKNRTYGCGKAGDSGIMIRKKIGDCETHQARSQF